MGLPSPSIVYDFSSFFSWKNVFCDVNKHVIELSFSGIVLKLAHNMLVKSIPNLRTLNLVENDILGGVSDFSGLKFIVSLNISGNSFQGSVTDVFVLKLEVLDLSRNQFQGHISQAIFI
ncbi:hypothetical protein RYX36_007760 [Vicia faba]